MWSICLRFTGSLTCSTQSHPTSTPHSPPPPPWGVLCSVLICPAQQACSPLRALLCSGSPQAPPPPPPAPGFSRAPRLDRSVPKFQTLLQLRACPGLKDALLTQERSLISPQLPRPSPIAPAPTPTLLRATGAPTARPPPGPRLTGPPHPLVSNPRHMLPGPGPRPGHSLEGRPWPPRVRSKGLFSASSPGVDALVTGSLEARRRPQLRGSSPSGRSLVSGSGGALTGAPPRTCCPTGSGLGKLGVLLDSLPLRLEFPRSHFFQKTQGKTVIQITDKTRFQSIRSLEHQRPPPRALPPSRLSPGPPPVVGPPTSPAGLLPAGPSAGHGAMRPPRPSTAARSSALRARDTDPFLREGQARAPRPQSVLPASARTPVLLCFVFTTVLFCPPPHPSTLLSPAGLRQSPKTSRGPSF